MWNYLTWRKSSVPSGRQESACIIHWAGWKNKHSTLLQCHHWICTVLLKKYFNILSVFFWFDSLSSWLIEAKKYQIFRVTNPERCANKVSDLFYLSFIIFVSVFCMSYTYTCVWCTCMVMPPSKQITSHYLLLQSGAVQPLWNLGRPSCQKTACPAGGRVGRRLQRKKRSWNFVLYFKIFKSKRFLSLTSVKHKRRIGTAKSDNSLISLGLVFTIAWGWLGPRWTLSVTLQRTTSVPFGGPVLTIGVSRWSDVSKDWRKRYSSSFQPTIRPGYSTS